MMTSPAASIKPGEPLLEARGLTRCYGRRTAVADVDLELIPGRVLGLLGPNGAGKTTTLEMLTGNLAPHAGVVRVRGMDLQRDAERARGSVGYLPDEPPLYDELRVSEYLGYCAALHGLRGPGRREAVRRATRASGIDGQERRTIRGLSRGYRQRLGLAQAILHDPAVVILDEPTVGLDPLQMRELRELIRDLAPERGILLSSHILPEVQATCTDVVIIHEGRRVHAEHIADRPGHPLARRWRVSLRQPPGADALRELPGVRDVEALGEGRYALECDADPTEAVVARSVAAGWELFEIHPVSDALEERFVALTGGGTAGAPP